MLSKWTCTFLRGNSAFRNVKTTSTRSIETICKEPRTVTEKSKDRDISFDCKELEPWPTYTQERLDLFGKLKLHSDAVLKEKQETRATLIKITLPDGKFVEGRSWNTTPFNIAQGISRRLADACVVAKVNDVIWDLDRPLEGDCTVQLLKFDDDAAKAVYWHSSSHVLGEAMERVYGGGLCYGPPIDQGFYYDMFIDRRRVSNQQDFPVLEKVMKSILKEKQPFERLEVTKENLLKLFEYNPFKLRLLNEKVLTPTATVYRCGSLIDLCKGPHLRHTGQIKEIYLYKSSSTYWEGKADKESLQRIYGISFPDKKGLKEWKQFQENATQRDHRKLGKDQELFFFHESSPGSCFFFPRGAFIYNTLIKFIKEEYRKRGFEEVISPNIYKSSLWITSGHWEHFAENMFSFNVERDTFALKPMNCPGHCLMYSHRKRSWRELPIRYADFGVLHRNEISGALGGLTRVRRFQQDDAHIFARPEQIKEEIRDTLDFLKTVYDTLGFSFKLFLSTRPEQYLGEIDQWNDAEQQLSECLNEFEQPWTLNSGDGAFYGPKIDIQITDALRRPHQSATIQLDFQLPIRFDLSYVTGEGDESKRPVIIHRAVLGSVERMVAILTENYGGKWPLWLSPRQIMVVSVSAKYDNYAASVKSLFHEAGFQVDLELDPGLTLSKKIRRAQLEQYNFILVVGEKEEANGTVNIRTRDNKVHGEHNVGAVIEQLHYFIETRHKNAENEFNLCPPPS